VYTWSKWSSLDGVHYTKHGTGVTVPDIDDSCMASP
jgi:hypothetical protein